MGKLTALEVKAAGAGHHGDGDGLWLQVTSTGAKTWVYRFTLAGKAREMGLGPGHIVSLAQARVLATECRRQRYAGIDPIEARRAKRGADDAARVRAMTFDQCAEAYVAAQEAGWRNAKHRAQWVATLATYASPVFGKLPVHEVDQALVLAALEPIWLTKNETAVRLRGRIEHVLDYATSRGLRTGENPARWKGHLKLHLARPSKVAPVMHHPALPYAELGGFMAELRELEGTGPRCLEFTILTAARTGETTGAEWSEINLEGGTWTVPGSRMKAGRDHRVPLSLDAIALLQALPRPDGVRWVFPGRSTGKAMSNMAMLKLLKRMGRGDLTVHGFRSTFRDWATEISNFPHEMAELALAHTIRDKVEAAYRRGDAIEKRRAMMTAWADYAGHKPDSAGVVVPMQRKAG